MEFHLMQQEYIFSDLAPRTYQAAKQILPYITDLLGVPHIVTDLGGGGGGWLKAFKEAGTEQILCIDHPSVQAQDLLISSNEFLPCDLEKHMPEPVKCDLAISTEFAEHIHASRSQLVVDFLTSSAPVVLFSAAIPRQGGTDHINERWPNFWHHLFHKKEYYLFDVLRPKIIHNATIPWWFRQNLYLYAHKDYINIKLLHQAQQNFLPDDFLVVHRSNIERPLGIREIITELPRALSNLISKKIDDVQL
jgi:hypothetical protein